jgi:cellulose synthase/poly-beta-1,6-N-acetylglucosamine synthase-like glycosyltransferase
VGLRCLWTINIGKLLQGKPSISSEFQQVSSFKFYVTWQCLNLMWYQTHLQLFCVFFACLSWSAAREEIMAASQSELYCLLVVSAICFIWIVQKAYNPSYMLDTTKMCFYITQCEGDAIDNTQHVRVATTIKECNMKCWVYQVN